jgi:hypothetical protein
MAYFPNAFKKVFIPHPAGFKTAGTTDLLNAGEFGFFDTKTWAALPQTEALSASHPSIILAMGSYHNVDKIGPHGGFKESVKSQPINPHQVHRFYKVNARAPRNQIVTVGYDKANASTAPSFEKGKQYLLRIDLKGSPLLRFLGRNAYHTFDASTGCADTCVDPCSPAAKVDPVVVLLQWADQIKNNPIFSNFINPVVYYSNGDTEPVEVDSATYTEVTDTALIANIRTGLELQVAYVDTKFGNCSFDPKDHFELEPIEILASIVDESGDPCKIPTLSVAEKQASKIADGTGEIILRDLIQFNYYRQEFFPKSNRRKETEDVDAVTFDMVNRNELYTSYYILHSVPRKNNPTSTLDSDQYLLQISVPQGSDMTAFETWFQAYLDSASKGVKLEDLSLSNS